MDPKTQDEEELPLDGPKKKKYKASKPHVETKLTDDDYEQIAARIRDEMSDTF